MPQSIAMKLYGWVSYYLNYFPNKFHDKIWKNVEIRLFLTKQRSLVITCRRLSLVRNPRVSSEMWTFLGSPKSKRKSNTIPKRSYRIATEKKVMRRASRYLVWSIRKCNEELQVLLSDDDTKSERNFTCSTFIPKHIIQTNSLASSCCDLLCFTMKRRFNISEKLEGGDGSMETPDHRTFRTAHNSAPQIFQLSECLDRVEPSDHVRDQTGNSTDRIPFERCFANL